MGYSQLRQRSGTCGIFEWDGRYLRGILTCADCFDQLRYPFSNIVCAIVLVDPCMRLAITLAFITLDWVLILTMTRPVSQNGF